MVNMSALLILESPPPVSPHFKRLDLLLPFCEQDPWIHSRTETSKPWIWCRSAVQDVEPGHRCRGPDNTSSICAPFIQFPPSLHPPVFTRTLPLSALISICTGVECVGDGVQLAVAVAARHQMDVVGKAEITQAAQPRLRGPGRLRLIVRGGEPTDLRVSTTSVSSHFSPR